MGGVTDESTAPLADAELREREEQYRSIFEATSDGLVISNMEGYVVEANPAFCRMSGYTRDELIGLHGTALTHPDSLYTVEQSLRTVREGGALHYEGLGLRKDRSVCPAEVHVGTFTYKGQRHMLAVVRDITERVQARELLEQRVEERTRELSTLLEVARNVASALELKPLLDLILDQMKVVADYEGASILTLEGGNFRTLARRAPGDTHEVMQHRTPVNRLGSIWKTLSRGEPVIIGDVRGNSEQARTFRQANGRLMETVMAYVRSWLAVPLMYKERPIGLLTLASGEPNFYTPRHGVLARAIATQAAVAIENARLYEQAQELAVLEERQRLSRELHDSVSQALYGIGLASESIRVLLPHHPDRAAQSNEMIRSLTQSGMDEMRALLFELRPESLELEGLVAALQKQARAVEARYRIPVSMTLCEEPDIVLSAKEALYRIAQEALHNAVKHAEPTRIEVRLDCAEGEVLLEVRDDGRGFEAGGSFPGHLGLHSMKERAARQGGSLEVETTPGKGTCVRARIPWADQP